VSLTVSQIPYEIVVTSAALKHEENIRRNFRYGLSEKKKKRVADGCSSHRRQLVEKHGSFQLAQYFQLMKIVSLISIF